MARSIAPLLTLVLGLCAGCAPPPGQQDSEASPAGDPGGSTGAVAPGSRRPSDEQIEALRAAAERHPDDAKAQRLLAIALFEAGRTDEALSIFERAAERDPGPANLLNLGRAYDRVSRYPQAEATYRRVLASAPNQPVALHALGNIALKRGETGKAIELYRQAIAAKPDYLLAHAHLADALKDSERTREAYQTYEKVLAIKPSNAQELGLYHDAIYEIAALDLADGAYERSAQMLQELLSVNPDHPNANYAYGQALLHLGRADEAQRAFETHMRVLARREPTGPVAMDE